MKNDKDYLYGVKYKVKTLDDEIEEKIKEIEYQKKHMEVASCGRRDLMYLLILESELEALYDLEGEEDE